MTYMGDSTEVMWGKFNNKRNTKKNESIKICVGIGKIRSEGQNPTVNVPDDVYSDYSDQLIRHSITEHLSKVHTQHTNRSRWTMTHDILATGTTHILAETMIRRAVTNHNCELYHALNKEIF